MCSACSEAVIERVIHSNTFRNTLEDVSLPANMKPTTVADRATNNRSNTCAYILKIFSEILIRNKWISAMIQLTGVESAQRSSCIALAAVIGCAGTYGDSRSEVLFEDSHATAHLASVELL